MASISTAADKLALLVQSKPRVAWSECEALAHLQGQSRKALQRWIQDIAFWKVGKCFEIREHAKKALLMCSAKKHWNQLLTVKLTLQLWLSSVAQKNTLSMWYKLESYLHKIHFFLICFYLFQRTYQKSIFVVSLLYDAITHSGFHVVVRYDAFRNIFSTVHLLIDKLLGGY